jgi:hypothetical protein
MPEDMAEAFGMVGMRTSCLIHTFLCGGSVIMTVWLVLIHRRLCFVLFFVNEEVF